RQGGELVRERVEDLATGEEAADGHGERDDGEAEGRAVVDRCQREDAEGGDLRCIVPPAREGDQAATKPVYGVGGGGRRDAGRADNRVRRGDGHAGPRREHDPAEGAYQDGDEERGGDRGALGEQAGAEAGEEAAGEPKRDDPADRGGGGRVEEGGPRAGRAES